MDQVQDFLSGLELDQILITSLVVLIITWLYMNYTRKPVEVKPSKWRYKPAPVDKDHDNSKPVQRSTCPQPDQEILAELERQLDPEDFEEIKKAVDLDLSDVKSVKQYVARLRSLTHKIKLTNQEKAEEEVSKQGQLNQIFDLINQHKDVTGGATIEDVREQMALYGL